MEEQELRAERNRFQKLEKQEKRYNRISTLKQQVARYIPANRIQYGVSHPENTADQLAEEFDNIRI